MNTQNPHSRRRTGLIWPVFIVVSFIWAVSLGAVFVERWSEDLPPVDRVYRLQEQTCKARYRDAAALDRCLRIMELERFQARSIMIANRVLASLAPPLIGFGVLVYLRRRRTAERKPGT